MRILRPYKPAAPRGVRDAGLAWHSPGSSPLLAALALPGLASAATHTARSRASASRPSLSGHGGFGLYNFTISPVHTGRRLLVSVRHWREDRALRRGDRRRRQQHVDASHRQRSLARQQRRAEHDRRRLHHGRPARSSGSCSARTSTARATRPASRAPRTRARSGSSRTRARATSIKIGGGKRQRGSRCRRATQLLTDSATNYAKRQQRRQPLDRRRRGSADLRRHEPHRHDHRLAVDGRVADALRPRRLPRDAATRPHRQPRQPPAPRRCRSTRPVPAPST